MAGGQGAVEAGQGLPEAALQVGDEHRRVKRLSDRAVMDLPVRLEVHRQVVLGIPPAIAAGDVDLPAADRLPQGTQYAQLVGDPLHPAPLVDDRLPPLPGHHAFERDPLPGGVVTLPT